MLVLKDVSKDVEGEWFDFEVRGANVEFKIRPLTAEVLTRIRKKYKKVRRDRDPENRQMITVEEYDEDAISDDMMDYVLEDFKGFGTDADTPMEVTLDNKKRILELPPIAEEQTVSEFVFEKAREIVAVTEEAVKKKEKK